MEFNKIKKLSTAICIVNVTDQCQSNWAKEICKNLSDQMIFKFSDKGFDIFIHSSEDAMLRQVAADEFYTHAVVIASGTSFKTNDILFDEILNLCKEDFSIAGHILDRKESYYELHHQFYILNIKDYKELNCPSIGIEESTPFTAVVPNRSEDNVHDDYVPLWISNGTKTKTYTNKLHGWNILAEFLKKDKTIIDIGSLRNYKQYFYYEHDHVFIQHLPELYHQMFFGSNFVPAWNSDTLRQFIDFSETVEQYVTTGTGFNWIKNLELLNYNENTLVIFTDINPNCLRFMKELVTNWDGTDYGNFYKNFIKDIVPNGPIEVPDYYYNEAQQQWEKFKLTFENFDLVWARVKKLKFKFILINFTATFNFNWLDSNKHTVINFSDLFTYTPLSFNSNLKYRIACENRLIELLKNLNPDIYLIFSARAANGFIDHSAISGKASSITLTDINSLKTPPWRIEEWTSPRMLR